MAMIFIWSRFLLVACFLWKIRKTGCLLKRFIMINLKNYLVISFCLRFLYFGFIFVSALYYLVWVFWEANNLVILHLKLPLKPSFFSFFSLLLERWAFAYFKLIYFSISRQNSFMEGDGGRNFCKVPDWILCFRLR